jgi:hypothetical protein
VGMAFSVYFGYSVQLDNAINIVFELVKNIVDQLNLVYCGSVRLFTFPVYLLT